jgi:hypothetical protein
MKRWTLIENGILTLVVEQDTEPFVYTDNGRYWVECPINIEGVGCPGPGWGYENSTFINPYPPNP